jgi:hypothetical protein
MEHRLIKAAKEAAQMAKDHTMTDKLTPDQITALKEAAEKAIEALKNQCNSQGELHLYLRGEADKYRSRFNALSTPHTILALLAEREALQDERIEAMAELIYLRKHGKDGAQWLWNDSKDVWREQARKALGE